MDVFYVHPCRKQKRTYTHGILELIRKFGNVARYKIKMEKSDFLGHLGGSVKHLTLDFGSGHDLTVHEIEPHIGLCTDSADPAWDSLSPSFSAPPLFMRSL